jgi:hypothetical protein
MWWIGGAVVLVGGMIYWINQRPKTFSYKGRAYRRGADGSITYADGSPVPAGERDEASDHWDSTHDSSSSDSSDGGGGDGGGGGGGD